MKLYRVKKEQHVMELLAEHRSLFVHRYSYSHDNLRRITRRMSKEGKLTMIRRSSTGFEYTLAAASTATTQERTEA